MNNIREKKHIWFVALFVFYSFISITPLLGGTLPPLIAPGVLLLMLLSAFRQQGSLMTNRITIVVLVFFAIDVLYHVMGFSERIGNAITRFACFMMMVVFMFMNDNLVCKEKKFVFYSILIIIAANIVDNIRLNMLYPNASILAIKYGESYKGLNIGTTGFNTMSLLFYVVCLFMLINTKIRWGRIFYAALCAVAIVYLLFFGMRGSVIAILFVITILMVVVKFVSKYKFLWLLVPLLIVPIVNPDFLFDIVANIIPEGRLSDRLDDIRNVSEQGLEDDSFSGRVRLYEVSLNTYTDNKSNFLFGIGEHKASVETVGQVATGVGGHSEFIDVLARWGTMGAILIFLIYYWDYKEIMKQAHDKLLKNQTKVMYLALILCGIFKAVFANNIGVVGFVLMPLSVWMLENEKN